MVQIQRYGAEGQEAAEAVAARYRAGVIAVADGLRQRGGGVNVGCHGGDGRAGHGDVGRFHGHGGGDDGAGAAGGGGGDGGGGGEGAFQRDAVIFRPAGPAVVAREAVPGVRPEVARRGVVVESHLNAVVADEAGDARADVARGEFVRRRLVDDHLVAALFTGGGGPGGAVEVDLIVEEGESAEHVDPVAEPPVCLFAAQQPR